MCRASPVYGNNEWNRRVRRGRLRDDQVQQMDSILRALPDTRVRELQANVRSELRP